MRFSLYTISDFGSIYIRSAILSLRQRSSSYFRHRITKQTTSWCPRDLQFVKAKLSKGTLNVTLHSLPRLDCLPSYFKNALSCCATTSASYRMYDFLDIHSNTEALALVTRSVSPSQYQSITVQSVSCCSEYEQLPFSYASLYFNWHLTLESAGFSYHKLCFYLFHSSGMKSFDDLFWNKGSTSKSFISGIADASLRICSICLIGRHVQTGLAWYTLWPWFCAWRKGWRAT